MPTDAAHAPVIQPFVYGGLPPCPGAYALYDLHGKLLYVGRAKDLKDTVQRHFNPSEDNPLLKGQVGRAVLYPTRTVTEAKKQEGRLFDQYLRATGRYPPANRNRPPEAEIPEDEIVRIRLRKAFHCPTASPSGPPTSGGSLPLTTAHNDAGRGR